MFAVTTNSTSKQDALRLKLQLMRDSGLYMSCVMHEWVLRLAESVQEQILAKEALASSHAEILKLRTYEPNAGFLFSEKRLTMYRGNPYLLQARVSWSIRLWQRHGVATEKCRLALFCKVCLGLCVATT